MTWLLVLSGLLILYWAIARWYLAGADLAQFDQPREEPMPRTTAPDAPAQRAVLQRIREFIDAGSGARGVPRLQRMREKLDELSDHVDLTGIRILPVTIGAQPAEWLLAESRSDPARRLLYIHGGAFTAGSPRSHRAITVQLARRTGFAVLAIRYRLLPEHSRQAGIDDCRAAYRWILENGPSGPGRATRLVVAGDSAGGNLTLTLLGWIRDQRSAGLPLPDGAIALSPLTDGTLGSPSLTGNLDSDPMLGPMLRQMRYVPRTVLLWFSWLQNRMRPCDPRLSPVYGDLAGLPPILVHASTSEVLIDDARRYVNRARAAGTDARLQCWPGMVHVWQVFADELPEARQAFEAMADFIAALPDRGEAVPAER